MNMKVALIQMSGFFDKDKTIKKMIEKVNEAAKGKPDIIVLPEMWNCPYGTKYFREYGEGEEGKTVQVMSKLAKELGVYLFGGTVSELDGEEVYNTCYVFNRQGKIIGKHRKKHLFDVNIQGRMAIRESDVLSAGNKLTVVDTEFGKIGVAVCFDVRFAEEFAYMTKEMGARAFIVPAAFNTTTGPSFWEPIMRGRAIDNQVYMIACAPAQDKNAPYGAYGHSIIVSPWGTVLEQADINETIITRELDMDYINSVRKQIPISNPL